MSQENINFELQNLIKELASFESTSTKASGSYTRTIVHHPSLLLPAKPTDVQNCPSFDPRVNYEALCKQMESNMQKKIDSLKTTCLEINWLQESIDYHDENSQSDPSQSKICNPTGVVKKKRRPPSELTREHKCPFLDCKKDYSSTNALKLHIKRNHCINEPLKSIVVENDKCVPTISPFKRGIDLNVVFKRNHVKKMAGKNTTEEEETCGKVCKNQIGGTCKCGYLPPSQNKSSNTVASGTPTDLTMLEKLEHQVHAEMKNALQCVCETKSMSIKRNDKVSLPKKKLVDGTDECNYLGKRGSDDLTSKFSTVNSSGESHQDFDSYDKSKMNSFSLIKSTNNKFHLSYNPKMINKSKSQMNVDINAGSTCNKNTEEVIINYNFFKSGDEKNGTANLLNSTKKNHSPDCEFEQKMLQEDSVKESSVQGYDYYGTDEKFHWCDTSTIKYEMDEETSSQIESHNSDSLFDFIMLDSKAQDAKLLDYVDYDLNETPDDEPEYEGFFNAKKIQVTEKGPKCTKKSDLNTFCMLGSIYD